MHTARGPRLSALDRWWGESSVVVGVGPIAVPTRSDLIAGLTALASRADVTRIGRQPDWAAGRWTRADDVSRKGPPASDIADYCSALVTHDAAPADDLGERYARQLGADRGGLPLRITTTADSVSLSIAHVLGDGVYMSRLLAAIVQVARSGDLPAWSEARVAAHPLRAALWDFFARKPSHAIRAARVIEPLRRPVAGGAGPAADVDDPGGARIGCLYRTSRAGALPALKAWRKASAPGLSTIPLTFAAVFAACREAGIEVDPRPLVLFDGRRYVPRSAGEPVGNFAVGLTLSPADAGNPIELDRAMRGAVEAGRPLTAMALGTALSAAGRARDAIRRGGSGRPALDAPPSEHGPTEFGGGPARIALSHMGRPADIIRLPWLDDGSRRTYTGALTPDGRTGLTFAFSEIGNRINASVSYRTGSHDEAALGKALDLLCEDPAGLIARSVAGPRAGGAHRQAAVLR